VAQFQILDSLQHLYLVYSDERRLDAVEEIYRRIDSFAAEIRDTFGQYDRVLFLSDNGAATNQPGRTHRNRPFYSVSDDCDLDGTNIRDFFWHVLAWVRSGPEADTRTPEGKPDWGRGQQKRQPTDGGTPSPDGDAGS